MQHVVVVVADAELPVLGSTMHEESVVWCWCVRASACARLGSVRTTEFIKERRMGRQPELGMGWGPAGSSIGARG